MTPCALAALCALTGAIRTVSGLQVAPRPKRIRCQRAAAPAPAPQENEAAALPAAAAARSEDAPPTSSNPFAALKKGFESAVQSATEQSGLPVRRRDEVGRREAPPARSTPSLEKTWSRRLVSSSRWLDRSAKAKVNELTGESEYKFGDLSRWLDKSAKDKVAELSSKDQYEFGDLHEADREPRVAAHDEGRDDAPQGPALV